MALFSVDACRRSCGLYWNSHSCGNENVHMAGGQIIDNHYKLSNIWRETYTWLCLAFRDSFWHAHLMAIMTFSKYFLEYFHCRLFWFLLCAWSVGIWNIFYDIVEYVGKIEFAQTVNNIEKQWKSQITSIAECWTAFRIEGWCNRAVCSYTGNWVDPDTNSVAWHKKELTLALLLRLQ